MMGLRDKLANWISGDTYLAAVEWREIWKERAMQGWEVIDRMQAEREPAAWKLEMPNGGSFITEDKAQMEASRDRSGAKVTPLYL